MSLGVRRNSSRREPHRGHNAESGRQTRYQKSRERWGRSRTSGLECDPPADSVGTRTDNGTGGYEHHAAKHGSNPKDTIGGKITDPELSEWILNVVGGPVTSAGNDKGELVSLGFRDGSESLSFLKGRMCDQNGRASVGAGQMKVSWCDQIHDPSGEMYRTSS